MVYGGEDFTPAVPQGFDAFSRWFDWAFKRFQEKWQVWLVQGLISTAFMMVWFVAYFAAFFGFFALSGGFGNRSSRMTGQEIALYFTVFYPLVMLLFFVFYSFLIAGMLNTAMKQAQGEEITVGDLFSGWRLVPRLVGALFVIGIPYLIGVVLCFIPGLIWMAFTWMTIPLIVTRRMGVFEAVGKSMAIARQNFWLVSVYGFVASLLSGMLAFLSMPALALLEVSMIADIYGITNPNQAVQPLFGSIPPPPGSYGVPPPPPQGPEQPPQGWQG